MSTTVRVDLDDRAYDITIGPGRLPAVDAIRSAAGDANHFVVISDAAVVDRYASGVIDELRSADRRVTAIDVPSGETSKSVDSYRRILEAMLDNRTDRTSVVVAVGGGVVGDLAGFCAASFARGIRFVQIPTTLLAMVDSSVGGKTGINLPGGKNMVGAFWQPIAVVADTDTLSTLPDRDYRSGLAEVIKYGVIEDAVFFDWLESNVEAVNARDADALTHIIATSCRCKAAVVADDERETTGRRAILNYGHTFAHAIEATAGYGEVLHGEAVAIGMTMAADLAVRLQRIDEATANRQRALIESLGLPTAYADADADRMIDVMAKDKKVAHGRLRFILPSRIGHVDLVGDVDRSLVVAAIRQTTTAASS